MARKARQAVVALGRRGQTVRIPDEVREVAVAYARQAHSSGLGWDAIAGTVGLSRSALERWYRGQRRLRRSSRVLPVTVREDSPVQQSAVVVLVTPAGYRLEGLGIDQAVEILRTLG